MTILNIKKSKILNLDGKIQTNYYNKAFKALKPGLLILQDLA